MTRRLVSTHLHNFHPLETVTMPLYTPSQLRTVTQPKGIWLSPVREVGHLGRVNFERPQGLEDSRD
jgi:hypothetical protein